MSDLSPIVVAVVAVIGVVLAWKLPKGLVKTVVLVGILALAAWYVFAGGVG
ncbi:MAG TPA: hypothetical protein VEB68_00715 [Croceibacterium sp.]|nr:hypothetical protein [Croceibacterium sp.]